MSGVADWPDPIVVDIPNGTRQEAITIHGRLSITWPGYHPANFVLPLYQIRLRDMDTDEDVGRSTLALLCLKAGDGVNGAQGPMTACLLQLSDAEGVPVSEPVAADPAIDRETLRRANVSITNDVYVAECWYVIAEMAIGEPEAVPTPEPEPDNELSDETNTALADALAKLA